MVFTHLIRHTQALVLQVTTPALVIIVLELMDLELMDLELMDLDFPPETTNWTLKSQTWSQRFKNKPRMPLTKDTMMQNLHLNKMFERIVMINSFE